MSDFDSFLKAINDNSVKDFKKYFKKGFLEKECAKDNCIPIHLACQLGSHQIVEALINNHCNIEACAKDNWRPIHYACQNNRGKVLEILIKNKCDIEAFTKNNYRAIHLACWNGHVDIVKILINNKCDIEAVNGRNQSPLELAKLNKHKKIIDIINGCREVTPKKNVENPFQINPNDAKQMTFKDPVENLILSMNLKCKLGCDHKFCSTTVRNKFFNENDVIGKGAFGIVCRVQDSQSNRKFAMKVMYQDNTGQLKNTPSKDDKNNSIENNINSNLGNLNHERIVKYFGAIECNFKLYIFMEYLPKGSLQDKIEKNKPNLLSSEIVIRFTKQMLEGLAFLHEKNIIHRDVKPGNVLLDKDENIKLADFGLGRSLIKQDGQKTNAKTFCGTIYFMAPEIINQKPYTTSADIWSLGVTVINMDTGELLFNNFDSQFSLMYKIGSMKKLDLPSMRTPLKDVVKKMLNIKSSQRPTASELLTLKIFE